MLLTNGLRATEANCREFGRTQCPMSFQQENRLLGNVGMQFGVLAAIPRAYGTDGILPCLTAGAMSSRVVVGLIFAGTAPINKGVSITANGMAFSFAGSAPLAALVNMVASGAVSFSGSAGLYGVASMTAQGALHFAGIAGLGGLFSIAANGALTFSGSAVTHSLAFLETTEQTGVMTEATIAARVWATILGGAISAENALLAAGSAGDPWSAVVDGELAGTTLASIKKILRNKTVTDPVAGTITVYATDGVTPIYVADLFEDADGTIPYKGSGAERRERLT